MTEIMGSVLLLLAWDRAKSKVLEYIVPIWEVTGTFGVFWVVVTDFSFPNILIPAAHIYAVAIMIFLILIVARNSTIAFGEFIVRRGWLDEKKLYLMYSLSTIMLGLVVLVILSSIISGAGVDLTSLIFSVSGWLNSAGNIGFIAGALMIVIGFAPVFYGLKPFRFLALVATFIGVVASLISFYLFSPSLLSPYAAIPVALTILIPILFNIEKTSRLVTSKLAFAIVAVVTVFSLNFLVYPSAFGQTVSVDSITTTAVMGQAFFVMTVVGGTMLAAMLAIYLFAVKKEYSQRGAAVH